MGLAEHEARLPCLEPTLESWEEEMIDDPHFLYFLRRLSGKPFHLLHPATFSKNLDAFIDVFDHHGVEGRVLFARKANRAQCWLHKVALSEQGCDVASGPELVGALAEGIDPSRLTITGADKSETLIWLGIRHGCLLALDSLTELNRVRKIAGQSSRVARVLLRLRPDTQPDTRFGLSFSEWLSHESVAQRSTWSFPSEDLTESGCLSIEGVCFHLDGYDIGERVRAIRRAVDQIAELRRRGHSAVTVDIGGGFTVPYTGHDEWESFQSTISTGDYHARRVPFGTYPYGNPLPTGSAMLSSIFDEVGSTLRENSIFVCIEPGRALLAGAGDTVFSVQGVKDRGNSEIQPCLNSEPGGSVSPPDPYSLIVVDGLSMSLSEQWKGREFSPDPTLWPRESRQRKQRSIGNTKTKSWRAAVGGASCMEYDMLTWRKVWFERPAEVGDLLIYHNTAGYQMDKNESQFHQLPLPTRFVLEELSEDGLSPENISVSVPTSGGLGTSNWADRWTLRIDRPLVERGWL